MKKLLLLQYCILIFISVCNLTTFSQPQDPYNGAFERQISFPAGTSVGTNDYLTICGTGWRRATDATSDYFHRQATSSSVSIPSNDVGYQNDRVRNQAPVGNAYAGVFIVQDVTNSNVGNRQIREYITTELQVDNNNTLVAAPLLPGNTYKVSFLVSLGDAAPSPFGLTGHGISNIGAYFSEDPIDYRTPPAYTTNLLPLPSYNLAISPQVYSGPFDGQYHSELGNFAVQTDDFQWRKVEGYYHVPLTHNAKRFITIGNFQASIPVDEIVTDGATPTANTRIVAFYYIDDVKIERVESLPPCNSCGIYFDIQEKCGPKPVGQCCYTVNFGYNDPTNRCGIYGIRIKKKATGEQLYYNYSSTTFYPINATFDFCTDKLQNALSDVELKIEYLDKNGNVINQTNCTTEQEYIKPCAQNICSRYTVQVANADVNDPRCADKCAVEITITDLSPNSPCPINYIEVYPSGGVHTRIVDGDNLGQQTIIICPHAQTKGTIELVFYNESGVEVCRKSFPYNCEKNCCDDIEITEISEQQTGSGNGNTQCCYEYLISQTMTPGCEIKNLKITEIPEYWTPEGTMYGPETLVQFIDNLPNPYINLPKIVTFCSQSHTGKFFFEFEDETGKKCKKEVNYSCFGPAGRSGARNLDESGKSDFKLAVKPNLVQDIFVAEVIAGNSAAIKIELIDILGNIKFENSYVAKQGINTYEYQAGDLPSGTYLIRLTVGDISYSIPLVIAH